MSTSQRSRNKDGSFHKKRGDTKVQNLKKEYSEFEGINGNTYLGTLKKRFDTDSLDGVLRALREKDDQ